MLPLWVLQMGQSKFYRPVSFYVITACIEFIYSQEDPIGEIHHRVKFKTNCSSGPGVSIWSRNVSVWSASYRKSKKTSANVSEYLIFSMVVLMNSFKLIQNVFPVKFVVFRKNWSVP